MKMNRTSAAAAVIAAGLVASLGALAPATVNADELTAAAPAATQSADADVTPSDDAAVAAVSAVAPSDESTAAAPEAKAPVADPVAKIGEKGYATLDAAVADAKDGDTIELLHDAETKNGFGLDSKDLTVNGNNHIITAKKLGIYLYKGSKQYSAHDKHGEAVSENGLGCINITLSHGYRSIRSTAGTYQH